MRTNLAVLILVTGVCPATTHTCATPDVLTWESFPPITPAAGSAVAATPFCAGWEAGWVRGWKDVKGDQSTPPAAPACPNACENITYADGYSRGFIAGVDRATGRNGP